MSLVARRGDTSSSHGRLLRTTKTGKAIEKGPLFTAIAGFDRVCVISGGLEKTSDCHASWLPAKLIDCDRGTMGAVSHNAFHVFVHSPASPTISRLLDLSVINTPARPDANVLRDSWIALGLA